MARRGTDKTRSGGVPGRQRRQRSNLRLVGLLTAVVALKITIVFQLQDHPLLQPDAGLDSAAYVRLARQVAAGDLALGPGLYFLSPLYIYFLAAVLTVADSLTIVRVVQAVLGTVAVAFIFLTARAWYGERAGWIAAILAALTGVFTFYEALILQSALDPILTAAALWCLTAAFRLKAEATRDQFRLKAEATEDPVGSAFRRKILIAGTLFGLQILNRPNMLVAVGGIVLVLLLVRRMRAAALLTAGVLVALSPVVIRNAVVSRQFALSSSQGGLNFYIGNHAGATGHYVEVPGVRANIEGQSEDTRRVAEAAAGRALTDAQVSAHFTGLALSWIRTNPGAAARLFAKKLALVFNARHQWLDFSYPYYAYDAGTSLWLLFVGPWLLVPLGLAGLVIVRGTADRGHLAFAAFVPFYAIGVAIFFVGERYRLPVLVPLCASAGGALDALAQAFRNRTSGVSRETMLRAAAVAAAATIVTFWPFAFEDGRFEERLRLSKVLMNRGDYGMAAMELERAHALEPSHTIAQFNLGMALISSGRASEGIAHARQAVDAGVETPGARYALAGAMIQTGDRDGAAGVLRAATPAAGDNAESCYRVAILALEAGARETAERYASQAVTLRPGWTEAEDLLAHIRSLR
jgi:4-amino-4-deoxy-L-arabinose transferase-like glycosyltransferase